MSCPPQPDQICIQGIEESTISNYFLSINQENFQQTAALFAPEGKLLAPFEKPIIGGEAIALYLTKEAKGMQLLPRQGVYETLDEQQQIKVTGKVKTSLFTVNVAWFFQLDELDKITLARIKLLASPQELLGLRSQANQKVQNVIVEKATEVK
ncbi:water-soluble carotenoid protein [Chondrocystis sp. NIES-4102]|nr:water-soluble carotenoid protein [Chondrocystis sp. NIES-4102]